MTLVQYHFKGVQVSHICDHLLKVRPFRDLYARRSTPSSLRLRLKLRCTKAPFKLWIVVGRLMIDQSARVW